MSKENSTSSNIITVINNLIFLLFHWGLGAWGISIFALDTTADSESCKIHTTNILILVISIISIVIAPIGLFASCCKLCTNSNTIKRINSFALVVLFCVNLCSIGLVIASGALIYQPICKATELYVQSLAFVSVQLCGLSIYFCCVTVAFGCICCQKGIKEFF